MTSSTLCHRNGRRIDGVFLDAAVAAAVMELIVGTIMGGLDASSLHSSEIESGSVVRHSCKCFHIVPSRLVCAFAAGAAIIAGIQADGFDRIRDFQQ
jgi:hypothetical protein